MTIENVQDMAKKMAIKTRAVLNYLNVAIVVTFLVIFHQFFALENGGSKQGSKEISWPYEGSSCNIIISR